MELDIANTSQTSTSNFTPSSTLGPPDLRDGYDLPVYGLDTGRFYSLHVPALTCIFLSLISAILTITLSFRKIPRRAFFDWTKSERFIVYMAICDGAFNVAHSMDHLHIATTKSHVYPVSLCQFYGVMLLEFIMAQTFMVNIVAVNAFTLMIFNKQLKFGKRDWRLLLWIFGFPFLLSMIALAAKQFGPNGSFCFFDGVNGELAQFLLTTLPLSVILIVNATLYVITWAKLRSIEKHLKLSLGKQSSGSKMKHAAVRAMSLFVLAFIFQWWAMALFGIWVFANPGSVPPAIHHTVTTFSNVGGIVNLGVYLLIRKRTLYQGSASSDQSHSTKRSGMKETSHTDL
uniref:G-protein coupled receptors family 1 profile domain-containing protein n=1 Tax=Magallana gigas TaxID=29159 RepID=A0A8W8HTV1_MAGGI|nr:medium-wave-sensitive opsin 1 [Crassostrea gigas]